MSRSIHLSVICFVAALFLSSCVSNRLLNAGSPWWARPVMVKNRLVNPLTGAIVGTITQVNASAPAEPVRDEPGKFMMPGDLRNRDPNYYQYVVDAQTRDAKPSHFAYVARWDERARVLRGLDKSGNDTWMFAWPGQQLNGGRTQNWYLAQWTHDQSAVYAACHAGVVALELESGKEIWRVVNTTHYDYIHYWSDLLVHLTYVDSPGGRRIFVTARNPVNGTEAWRVELPINCRPNVFMEWRGFLVVRNFSRQGEEFTWLLKPSGEVVWKAAGWGEDFASLSDGTVIGLSSGVSRLDTNGEQIWSYPFSSEEKEEGWPYLCAAVVSTNRAIFSAAYSPRDGSQAHVRCHDVSTGKVLWTTECQTFLPLPIWANRSSCTVYMEVRGDVVVVVSQASFGSYVELLELASGRSLRRHEYDF